MKMETNSAALRQQVCKAIHELTEEQAVYVLQYVKQMKQERNQTGDSTTDQ